MSYRDDLEAAHARIKALEREVAQRGPSEATWLEHARLREELAATHRERAQLGHELAGLRRELAQVRAELARAREDGAKYVERIRILQDERAKRHEPPGDRKPTILERGARRVCPACRAAGREVGLLADHELTASICPQCTAITLLR
jgi:chromosome segregation ATPase